MSLQNNQNSAEGKLIYLLLLTIGVQFLYPLSISEEPLVLIAFQLFYVSLFLVGILVIAESRLFKLIMIGLTILWIACGASYAFNPNLLLVSIATFGLIIVYQFMLVYALTRYIFNTPLVNRDILYAACIVYLLLGAIFTPIFSLIELFTWYPDQIAHAFSDGSNAFPNEMFPWQTLTYYSYTNLTTLGYGDVLPITPWARSMATLESVIGVLYLTIILARLVGLYAAEEVEDATN